jgi:hypothetical protein
MSHEMTMRLIVFGFVAVLFLVGFAMGVDSGGGRPTSDVSATPPPSSDVQEPTTSIPAGRDSVHTASNAPHGSPGPSSQY